MSTMAFSVLLTRIKSLVFFAFIVVVTSACTQGDSTVTSQPQGGGGIAVPAALLTLPAGSTLTAYIQINGGDRQQMTISGNNASISLTGISQGDHTFTVEFEYTANTAPDNPIILARASETMEVGSGTNVLEILEEDYDTASFDEDGDGVSNLEEVSNGSNPFAGITVSAISGNTGEDGTTAIFSVVLTSAPTDDVSIAISSADASEGSVDQASIAFDLSNWDTPQTITVTGADDDFVDGDIGYAIIISAATSTDTDYNGLDPVDIDLVNTDDDTAGFAISTISRNTTEAGVNATFTLALTSMPSADVDIGVISSDISEGVVDVSAITFAPSNWNSPQTITVTGIDDSLIDGNQSYAIQFAATTSADSLYDGQNPAAVQVVNVDDDSAAFNISPISRNTGEDGTSATFSAQLTTQPTASVTIAISSSDVSEGSVDQASIAFDMNNWNIPQTITVTGVDDAEDDGDQPYTIQLAAATSGDTHYNGLIPGNVSITNTDDDTAGFIVGPLSGDTAEAGTTASFTVALSSAPTASVSIAITSTDVDENTVSPSSINFDADNWNTAQTITVSGVDDAIDDGDQTTIIVLAAATSADVNYHGQKPADVTVTNSDDDGLPTVILSIDNASLAEAGGVATVTATSSGVSAQNIIVNLVYSGTSSRGNDYTSANSISITAGNTTGTVQIGAQQDSLDEDNESIVIDIDSVTNGIESGAQKISATIIDDDQQPSVTLSIDTSTSLSEATGMANLTASLSEESGRPVTVNLAYTGTAIAGSDYAKSDAITIPPGNTFAQVALNVIDDALDESDETIVIDISSVHNGAEITAQQVTVSIADDDLPLVTFITAEQSVAEDAGTVTLSASLDQAAAFAVSVPFSVTGSATPGADHDLGNGEIIVLANETTGTTAFSVQNDDTVEGAETIIITLGSPVNAALGATTVHTVTITDNDNPGFVVSPISGNTREEGGTATFTLALLSAPIADVSIAISSDDASEGVTDKSAVTFSESNWNIAQTITVTGLDDSTVDGDQNYSIILAAATSSDTHYNGLKANDVALINTDNDNAGFVVSPISGNTREEGGTATFTLALLSAPIADVSIAISSDDASEGVTDKSAVTFSESNWNIAQTITITGLDDSTVDGDQNYSIILAAAISNDTHYNGLKANDVMLINTDKNLAPSASNVSISDGNVGGAVVGDSLTGSYTFTDVNGDLEGVSTYRWLRNGVAINGASSTNYTLVAADGGQNITFEVTPVAATGVLSGVAVVSSGLTVDLEAALLSLKIGIKQLQFSWSVVSNATHYKLMENPDGSSGFSQLGADITTTSHTVDIAVHRQDWPNARYLLQACDENGCSSSSEVSTLGGMLSAIAYVKASNTGASDWFGWSVALSGDGNTLAVGASQEASNATGISTDGSGEANNSAVNSGAVYVFSRSAVDSSWSQQAYVKASNTGAEDWFGDSVALSGDGNTLAVGAYLEDSNATGISTDGSGEADNSAGASGAVYVFSRSGGSWSQQAYVKASNTGESDQFGYSVALGDDGNTLAVGAYLESSNATGISTDGSGEADNSADWAGAVYVFSRSGGSWSQQAYVKASNTEAYDRFGRSVALSGDGNTLAVKAHGEGSNATGISTNGSGEADNSAGASGAVYVFSRSGGSWSQQAYVKASNTGAEDWFGDSVALSGDGNTLAVGAHLEDSSATGISTDGSGEVDNSADGAGAVYVFGRSGGSWSQQAYVKASNTGADDRFGQSVALNDDGNTLAVGAHLEDSNATGISTDGSGEADNSADWAGAVYVFGRSGGSWSQQAYVKASNTGAVDFFGYSVALSGDGNTLAVGAHLEDSSATGITHGADATGADNNVIHAGAVYLY